jgi:hypothetical protein
VFSSESEQLGVKCSKTYDESLCALIEYGLEMLRVRRPEVPLRDETDTAGFTRGNQ